ncbi:MAG TPA: 23S rRNA (guanosine(2251)-2'-O)-methyltransferase RlmB [Rhodothermales bacterium]|nr:23S rRNA (guanosine(2251)-2'-O)-methyltransferase RlmB [Rhodothermales bacterium]
MSDLLLIGRTPVREALERRDARLEKLYLPREAKGLLADLHRLAREAGVPVQFVPPPKLDALARGGHHQGVVAVLSGVAYHEAEQMLDEIAADYDALLAWRPLLVALDGLEDPHNVGAVLRSAVAAGAAAVLVPAQGTAPIGAVALKASAGTALHLPIARVSSLVRALEGLKERGYTVVGAAGEGVTLHTAFDWTGPVVLVVGSEGRGLSPAVRRACDALVRIAMPGPAESLNASVAAGVLLFEAVRQRQAASGTDAGSVPR